MTVKVTPAGREAKACAFQGLMRCKLPQ